uniref:C2 domain-containing protein n=1 Tax=Globodera pallida TaxID=36090 RepID=A0A183CKV7_GLOPA
MLSQNLEKTLLCLMMCAVLKRQLVYRKCLQSPIYPISATTPHNFLSATINGPNQKIRVWDEDNDLKSKLRQKLTRESERLFGPDNHRSSPLSGEMDVWEAVGDLCQRAERQGQNRQNADCLQRAAEKSNKHGEGDRVQNLIAVIRDDRMKAQERNKPETFGRIANSFGVDDKTQQEVLICAKGLSGKDKTGKSDPYVTAQVGKVRKRTRTIHQELNPVWNEKFTL